MPMARPTSVIAAPAVALPVVGHPSAGQALRRPPMLEDRRAHSAGNHRRPYSGSRVRRDSHERYTRPTRANLERDAPSRPTASERARQRREEREIRQARRDAADRELRNRSIASSEPDSERSSGTAARSRSPTPSVTSISLTAISARPTPAGPTPLGSEGSASYSDPRMGVGVRSEPRASTWTGVIIDTPRAPSLPPVPAPPAPRFEPDPRVSVATRTALWERAGFDNVDIEHGTVHRPGTPVAVGLGYVGDVLSLPIETPTSQRTDSNDTRPPFYSASDAGPIIEALIRERGAREDARIITDNARAEQLGADREIQALRAELQQARQLSEHQVSHVAGIARSGEAQAAALAMQVEIERQRVRNVTQMGEAQVAHVAGIATQSQAESSALAAALALEQQRQRDSTRLGEAQVAHVTGIAVTGEAQAAALTADLERERQRTAAALGEAESARTRAVNLEHFAAASDRALGEYRSEVGAEVTAQLDAYQANAQSALNSIAAGERQAAEQAEAAAAEQAEQAVRFAQACAREEQRVTTILAQERLLEEQRIHAQLTAREALWQDQAREAAATAQTQLAEQIALNNRAEASAVAEVRERFQQMERNMAAENARREAETRQAIDRALADRLQNLRSIDGPRASPTDGSPHGGTPSAAPPARVSDLPALLRAEWPDSSLPPSPEESDPILAEARSEAERFKQECAILRQEMSGAGVAGIGALNNEGDDNGSDRGREQRRRNARIGEEDREPSPADSAMAAARERARAMYYEMHGQGEDGSSNAGSEWSRSSTGSKPNVPTIVVPDPDDLWGEDGVFKGVFVDPTAKARKTERTKSRLKKNKEKRERNRERTRNRRVSHVYESASEESDSSGDKSHKPKDRPGTGKNLDTIRVEGGFPKCRDIKEWDIKVANRCYESAGYTDRLEFTWLEQVLRIPDEKRNSLAIVPEEMADMDKLLCKSLRREGWLPADLARDIQRLERALLRLTPIRTMTGQLVYYLVHRSMKLMPQYYYQYSVRHLWNIAWKGDKPEEMKSFLNTWDEILENMHPQEVPMVITLTDVFKDQFAKSKVMEDDYKFWKRKRADDPEKTFHYLRQCMEDKMEEDQTDKNKVDQMKAHDEISKGYDPLYLSHGDGGRKQPRRPAAPATEGGGGRGRGKGTKNPGGGGGGGGKDDGKGRPTNNTPPFMSEANRAILSKMHCYFWHKYGKCKYGKDCVMKHVDVTDAVKAKLRHPADIIADAKAKATAAPAVPRDQSLHPDPRAKSKGRGRGTGKGKDKDGGKGGKGRDRSRTPGGTPIDKTGKGQPPPKGGKGQRSPHSPVPRRSESLGSQGGLKTNKEIEKEYRLPGFCKDFRAGNCDRPIIGNHPTRCKIGAHVSEDGYKTLREKQKVDVKGAKATRNARSQSAPPNRP